PRWWWALQVRDRLAADSQRPSSQLVIPPRVLPALAASHRAPAEAAGSLARYSSSASEPPGNRVAETKPLAKRPSSPAVDTAGPQCSTRGFTCSHSIRIWAMASSPDEAMGDRKSVV